MLPLFAIGWIWAQKWLTSCGEMSHNIYYGKYTTLQLTAGQLDDEPVVARLNATR